MYVEAGGKFHACRILLTFIRIMLRKEIRRNRAEPANKRADNQIDHIAIVPKQKQRCRQNREQRKRKQIFEF
jgi:hypothetical protein